MCVSMMIFVTGCSLPFDQVQPNPALTTAAEVPYQPPHRNKEEKAPNDESYNQQPQLHRDQHVFIYPEDIDPVITYTILP